MDVPFTSLERRLRMVRSLLIKVAMLGVTLGSLIWIGSVTPIRQVSPPHIQAAPVAVSSPSTRPATDGAATANAPSSAGMPEASNSPVASSVTSPTSPSPDNGTPDSLRRVDLNRATASDLEALPGIGPKLAHRVIEHRTSHGPFKRVEDLRQVKGIGHKKFDRLRSHVLVTHVKTPSRPKGAL